MILRVTVPTTDSALRSGFVATWHKAEGDRIEFGEDLCDIVIDAFARLERTHRATLLGSTPKFRRRRSKVVLGVKKGRGQVTVRLVSAESGVRLGKVLVEEGGRIEVGSLIAVMTGADGDLSGNIETAPEARIVLNVPDTEGPDDFA